MDKYSEFPACAEASASRRNPKSEILMKEIMTPRETAEYLNIHVRTIYRLAKNGDIPCRKVGGSWRFKKEALDQWLSGSEKPS